MARGDPPLRWAVLGTGDVSRKFVLGLRALEGTGRVEVVGSRDRGRAERFAASVGVEHGARLDLAATHPGVDAVYVATPPCAHEELAVLSMTAGKAVLVEKPFAMDAPAARRIAAQAEACGVFCMEAMWTRFLPLVDRVRDRVGAGDLGELRGLDGRFMGSSAVDPSRSMFDPAQGGGALMHRGVYALSLARHLLGPVRTVAAVAHIGSTGVDEDCALVLSHHGGGVSTVRAGLRSTGRSTATLYGTRATVEFRSPIYRPPSARVLAADRRSTARGGAGRWVKAREGRLVQGAHQVLDSVGLPVTRPGRRLVARYAGNGYAYEARAVATAVTSGLLQHPLMPLAESIDIMELIDTARASWQDREGSR